MVAQSPPPVAQIVHNVNTLTTPCFAPPHVYQGLVHGVVVGSTGDANLGSAPALVVGPISQRSSSLTHVAPSTAPLQGDLANFYPDFLKKRATPARHSAVADQVDKELLLTATEPGAGGREFSGLSEEIREFIKTTKEGNTGKDETWTRLTEMTGFSLGGFGFFQTRLGMGTYNRERKATILRQFATDKDALRDGGLRVPIGNRIAHAAAALTWGAVNADKPGGDTLTLADCIPHSYEAYDQFSVDGKKFETRGKQPQTIDAFTRAAKQHVELFSLFFGREHAPERSEVITTFQRLHEAEPEVFPLVFLISSWEAMTFRYISEVMDGTRRLMRMLPDNVRKTEYRRKALSPDVNGLPRWEFPTTWLMEHHTGYWLPIAIPKMEETISKSARKAVLHQPSKHLRAAGESSPPDSVPLKTVKTTVYPAGLPLRPDEIQRARGHRPRSLEGGESLCWDFSSHAGCANPESSCARGKHEVIKTRGLHPLIRMHLARRGGHKSEKKILPADVDGVAVSLRAALAEQDKQYVPQTVVVESPPTKNIRPKGKGKSKASGVNRVNLRYQPRDTAASPTVTQPGTKCSSVISEEAPPFTKDQTTLKMGVPQPLIAASAIVTASPLTQSSPSRQYQDLRDTIPRDLLQVNTTPIEEPVRKLLYPNDRWTTREIVSNVQFPVEPTIDQQMSHVDQWCTRSRAPLPPEILPVIKHRMMSSMPELSTDCPNDEWMYKTLGEALVFLSKTGSKKDAQRALAALAVLHDTQPPQIRAGRPSPVVKLGDQMACIDYSSQTLSIGELNWL